MSVLTSVTAPAGHGDELGAERARGRRGAAPRGRFPRGRGASAAPGPPRQSRRAGGWRARGTFLLRRPPLGFHRLPPAAAGAGPSSPRPLRRAPPPGGRELPLAFPHRAACSQAPRGDGSFPLPPNPGRSLLS